MLAVLLSVLFLVSYGVYRQGAALYHRLGALPAWCAPPRLYLVGHCRWPGTVNITTAWEPSLPDARPCVCMTRAPGRPLFLDRD